MSRNNCEDCGHKVVCALWEIQNELRDSECTHYQPTLTPQNEWVSVEDTVPDPGERVLATDGIFVGEAYRSSANSWFRHTGFPWRNGVTGRTVRFWMPLPAPYDRRPPERQEEKYEKDPDIIRANL